MEFNARHGFAAGIDLGPTKTRLAVADLRGERLAHKVIPTPSGDEKRCVATKAARLEVIGLLGFIVRGSGIGVLPCQADAADAEMTPLELQWCYYAAL